MPHQVLRDYAEHTSCLLSTCRYLSSSWLEREAGGWREAAPPWLLPAGRTNKLSKCSAGSQADNHFADWGRFITTESGVLFVIGFMDKSSHGISYDKKAQGAPDRPGGRISSGPTLKVLVLVGSGPPPLPPPSLHGAHHWPRVSAGTGAGDA